MKHIKKSSIYLGTLFLFCCLAAFGLTPNKGNAENISVEAQSISWEITEDGVLRISGEGMIPNNYRPWVLGYEGSLEDIKSIVFEEGITRIGNAVISTSYPNVVNISFPSTLKEIGDNNFYYGFDKLDRISFPARLETIGIGCFTKLANLQNIYIPMSVKSIGGGTFTQNPSLEKIEVDAQNKSYTSINGILYNYDKTLLMVYPTKRTENKFTVPDGVEEIANFAFYEATSIQEVVLPFGVKTLGSYAFCSCNNLEKVDIPESLINIRNDAFNNCLKLKSINIPSSVKYIGDYAFYGCPFEKILIPDSVTSMAEHIVDSSTIIVCTKGSYADRYAQENGYNILYLDNHSNVYEDMDSIDQLKKWEKASAKFLEFIIKHINDDKSTFTHFVGIMVDGEHVSPENYTAEPGSLILRLKASYLETLSPGEHTLKAIFDDGDIEIPFLVDTEKAIDYTKFDDVAVPTDTFTFKKVWQGDHEDSIDFTLYHADGTVYHHGFDKRVVSKTEWRYNAYFSAPAACYVIEKPVPGYQIKYVNVGVYADITDRCCDGGTIINKKIPKTGDAADFALWAGIIALGVVGLTTTIILTKRKKAHK